MTNKRQCYMYLVKFKNKNCQNIKRLSTLLFSEGKMHQNQSFCFQFYASVLLKQYSRDENKHTCYNIQYIRIFLKFNLALAHIITTKWSIMPL